jgi:pimeloyl-ACP methyl ester carboxylesterase
VGIALLVGLGIAVWWLQPQPLLPEARAAMASTATVAFSQDKGWLEFRPTGDDPSVGLILYPGGKVEPAGYARSAQAIAEQGYLVIIVPMPLNLAVLGADRATDVIKAYPAIEHWAIGGHSLGGAMAGQYADQHPDAIDGVAFWASFPNGDLSDQPGLAAVSILGSLDGGATRFVSEATMATLPEGTRFEVIEGGNHEQMGDYTGQPNDPPATISRDDQQARVQAATIAMLDQLAAAG